MASTYLQRTFGTPTSRKIFTVSLWFKRASLGSTQNFFGNGTGTNTDGFGLIDFLSDDRFRVTETPDYATQNYDIVTSRKFRDTSGWYHIVVAVDTTQATASDRIKIYTNGQLETSLDNTVYPSLNLDTKITLNNSHMISRRVNSATDYFDGSMAHYHFIDGTAYDASAFGETDATTGIWKPKTAPSVTYGTNGFFLKFENSGSLGLDSSGNGNNFTVNGTPTQTVDTPSNVFCTMNPLAIFNPASTGTTFSNGNNTLVSSSSYSYNFSTLAVSKGKWYCEMKLVSASGTGNGGTGIGVAIIDNPIDFNFYPVNDTNLDAQIYNTVGELRANGVSTAYGSSYTSNDIVGVALDMDNGRLFFSKNGVWQNSGDPVTGTGAITDINTSKTYALMVNDDSNAFTGTFQLNFGNGYFGTTAVASGNADGNGLGIFEYAPPTGYLAICTKNINSQEYA